MEGECWRPFDLVDGIAPGASAVVGGLVALCIFRIVALRLGPLGILVVLTTQIIPRTTPAAVRVTTKAFAAVLQGDVSAVSASAAAFIEGVGVVRGPADAAVGVGFQIAAGVINETADELRSTRLSGLLELSLIIS